MHTRWLSAPRARKDGLDLAIAGFERLHLIPIPSLALWCSHSTCHFQPPSFLFPQPWLLHLMSLVHLGWVYLDHELFREGNTCRCMALQHLVLFRWDLRATRAESIHRRNEHSYRRCKHSISFLRAKFWKKASPSPSSTLGEDLVLIALLRDTLKASLRSIRKQTPD